MSDAGWSPWNRLGQRGSGNCDWKGDVGVDPWMALKSELRTVAFILCTLGAPRGF